MYTNNVLQVLLFDSSTFRVYDFRHLRGVCLRSYLILNLLLIVDDQGLLEVKTINVEILMIRFTTLHYILDIWVIKITFRTLGVIRFVHFAIRWWVVHGHVRVFDHLHHNIRHFYMSHLNLTLHLSFKTFNIPNNFTLRLFRNMIYNQLLHLLVLQLLSLLHLLF